MEVAHPISSLMFFTLFAGFGMALLLLAGFLMRASNRHAADVALLGNDGHRAPSVGTEGALPEIIGVVLIAVLAMAALALGHKFGV